MSTRTILVVLLAILCGVSAAVGYSMMSRSGPKVDSIQVVVTTTSVARGTLLTEEMLKVHEWPKNLLPPNSIDDPAKAIGRTVMTAMVMGEPVMMNKLADENSGSGLAALIEPGTRAYTIQTSRVASNVAGFVLPGNRVDVLCTLRESTNEASGGGSTTTLLQAVEILAVDARLDATSGDAKNSSGSQQLRSVTLKVTPDQAASLDLGQTMGALTLSLRNPLDLAEGNPKVATLNILKDKQDPVLLATRATDFVSNLVMKPPIEEPEEMEPLPEPKEKPSVDAPPKPAREFHQIQTLRGRHRGRMITVRN